MKIKFKSVLIVLAVALVTAECKKKNDEPASDPAPSAPSAPSGPNNLADVFAKAGAPTLTTQISATTAQTLNVSGARVIVPANAFIDQMDNPVTGNIDIVTKGVFSKSEIILSGAPANNAAGKLVATKGCVKTSATQNGQVLRVAPTTTVKVSIQETNPGNLATNLKKYYASKVSVTNPTQCWKTSPDSIVKIDTVGSQLYYTAVADSMSWLNLGYEFDAVGPTTTITVNVPDTTFDGTNCMVYVSINGANVVGALYYNNITKNYTISGVPVSKPVRLVVIGAKSGQYYSYFSSDITLTAGTPYSQPATLQSNTLSGIQTTLNALP